MRQVALDVHQGFCEVAIRQAGETRSAGRVATTRDALELFAGSLCPTDEVVMEATGPAMEIARIIEPRGSWSPTPRMYGLSLTHG